MGSLAFLLDDLARCDRASNAVRALIDDIDFGAADPEDLAPALALAEEFVLAYLFPALREVVTPHLHATGRLRSVSSELPTGAELELGEAVVLLRSELAGSTRPRGGADGARSLARALALCAARLRGAFAEATGRHVGFEHEDARFRLRFERACPGLDRLREDADARIARLEAPW